MTVRGSQPPASAPRRPDSTRRRLLAAGLALPALLTLTRPALAAPQPRPFNARVIQSGHSLTDPIVPALESIVRAIGGKETIGMKMDRSTVPGSPMENRWQERNRNFPDAVHDIAGYDVLVLTERVPLSATLPWHASEQMALNFFDNTWTKGNDGKGAETILYASWVDIDSGPDTKYAYKDPDMYIPFRQRMDTEMIGWAKILDFVNANRPAGSPAMVMIPGPLVMAALHDALQAGTAPGISRMEDLFDDMIHVNKAGAFMIALAHYAVIYRRNPRDLPARVGVESAGSQATADWMKAMVWDVVRAYPKSGLV